MQIATTHGCYQYHPLSLNNSSNQVVDYLPVTTDTVEAAVVQYGSVMTCMAWSETKDSPCYMKTYGGGFYTYFYLIVQNEVFVSESANQMLGNTDMADPQ